MHERIEGLRQSVVKVSQRMQAPKTWLGSEGVNVLQVLCDLLDLVEQMNGQLASHTHGPTPPPSNAVTFTATETSASMLAMRLKSITLL